MSTSLAVRDLEAGYGQATVLDGVSFDAGAGEIVSIVGANGAGKTTLLNTIAGLIPARGGSITLGERDITRMRAHELPAAASRWCPKAAGSSRS